MMGERLTAISLLETVVIGIRLFEKLKLFIILLCTDINYVVETKINAAETYSHPNGIFRVNFRVIYVMTIRSWSKNQFRKMSFKCFKTRLQTRILLFDGIESEFANLWYVFVRLKYEKSQNLSLVRFIASCWEVFCRFVWQLKVKPCLTVFS